VQRTKGKVIKRCIYKSKAESFNHEIVRTENLHI